MTLGASLTALFASVAVMACGRFHFDTTGAGDGDGGSGDGSNGACVGSAADVRVSTGGVSVSYPTVVYTGSEFGVVWEDYRDGNEEIYFHRVDSAGTPLGTDVRVTADVAASYTPRIVWTGSEYGVAWEDRRIANREYYFGRISAAGAPSGIVTLGSGTGRKAAPAIAWNGNEYAIAWEDSRNSNYEVYFARYTTAGVLLGAETRITTTTGGDAVENVLLWNGTGYMIVWVRYDANIDVVLARLDANGTPLGVPMQVSNAAGESIFPVVAWTGSEYGVAWQDLRSGSPEIYFRRYDAQGGPLTGELKIGQTPVYGGVMAIAPSADGYTLTWEDTRDGNNSEVYIAQLDPTGALVDMHRMSADPATSHDPSFVEANGKIAAVWTDSRNSASEVYLKTAVACP